MSPSLDRLRILHLVVSDAFAGVERYVSRLAAAQAAAGHRVVVIGGRVPAMQAGIGDDVRVPVFPSGGLLGATRRLRAVGRRADVIHVHMTSAEIAASLAAITSPSPRGIVVSTRHFGRPRGHGPQAKAVAAIARRTIASEIAISEFVAREIDGAATVVYTGVEERPDGLPAVERERVVLLAQRLELEKRGDFALRTFAESGLPGRGWRLRIAGDGALRPQLERLAAELGLLDSAQFLGSRGDVAELMATASIMLAPCDVEALGLSVLEAMASGLPVVAAAAGGHLELLDGLDHRAMHPADDLGSAAAALRALADDGDGRDRFAAAARSRQRTRFTLDGQVTSTERVYRSVLR